MKLESLLIALALAGTGAAACAQTEAPPVGSVLAADATVTAQNAAVRPAGGRVALGSQSAVLARDHAATIALTRGGEMLLCQASSLHVTRGTGSSLLLALDRGSFEIAAKPVSGDVVMTPDLHMALAGGKKLDLRLRVSRNGDTCVENRGRSAPTLAISDAFGETVYTVKPGQHVLFEHGSLREVVDRETIPCGCPLQVKRVPLAEAALRQNGAKVTPEQAAAAYPFPEAESAGLAEPKPAPPLAAGANATHVQVDSTLTFDAAHPAPAAPKPRAESTAQPAQPAPPAPRRSRNPFKATGRYFKHIFVR